MYRKNLLLTCITLFIVLSSFAQDKKVAMLETIAMTPETSIMVKSMVRGELTKSLIKEEGYSAFTRLDIDQLMKELNFQESGMINDEQRNQLGTMTGADYICISKVTQEGGAYYLESFLVHIESGRIENPATAFVERGGLAAVNKACKEIAKELVGHQSGNITINNDQTSTTKPETTTSYSEENYYKLPIVEVNGKKIMLNTVDLEERYPWAEAKEACANLVAYEYEDWVLPSKDELYAICKKKRTLNSLNSTSYWSSDISANNQAWYVNIGNCSKSDKLVSIKAQVRCVRRISH